MFFTNRTSSDIDANGLSPLEDELSQYYFAEHVTGPLTLSKEDIGTLGKSLRKMLVFDPRNRAPAHVLSRSHGLQGVLRGCFSLVNVNNHVYVDLRFIRGPGMR